MYSSAVTIRSDGEPVAVRVARRIDAVRGRIGEDGLGLGDDPVRLGADERQRPGVDALVALGALARDEHGHAERGRLLLDPAGVGDDHRRLRHQPGERRVGERLGADDVRVDGERLAELRAHERIRMERHDEAHLGMRGRQPPDRVGDTAEPAVPVLPPVGGDDDERIAGGDRVGDGRIVEDGLLLRCEAGARRSPCSR